MNSYNRAGLQIKLPGDLKIKQQAPSFYAERSRPLLSIAISLIESIEAYEATKLHLKSGPVDSPQISPRVIVNRPIEKPFEGWELILENKILATGAYYSSWIIILKTSPTTSAYIEIGGQGEFKDNEEIWRQIVESINIS